MRVGGGARRCSRASIACLVGKLPWCQEICLECAFLMGELRAEVP